jgi:Kef-type K+ transport system membrane component KefB
VKHNEIIFFLAAISLMLLLSRVASEACRKIKFPMVMGELIVGIVLGPTILGKIAPSVSFHLFPLSGSISIAMQGITTISVVMLLFVAGMEVQLPMVLKQGKVAISTGLMGMIIPFALGFGITWFFPTVFHYDDDKHRLLLSLFMGTAMSISALPVIARILMDLNLFKTSIGMIIIASAMFNDLIGWLIFSLILGLMEQGHNTMNVGYTMSLIIGFGLFMFTIGKRLIDKALPWMQNKLSWPGGVLAFCLGACFMAAAFTELIGVHAILGAFIMGIAFGDSVHLKEQAREIIHQFVTNIFAPLFFVSIGLKVNFIDHFNLSIVVIIFLVACVGKVVGAGLGARMGGLSRNNAIAVGFGLNARGAMEIILGTLALNAGLISQEIFVALVIMAMLTSILSAPFMKKFVEI